MLSRLKRSAPAADENTQMRTFLAATATLVLVGLAYAAAGSSAPPSAAVKAKDAEAAKVLAQVNALDQRFGAIVDAWDGAKIQLAATAKQLAINRAALTSAKAQSRIAQQRAARLLVTIYEGESPDLIQLLAGSSKLSDVINAVQYSSAVASSAQRVATDAIQAKNSLIATTARLQQVEHSRRATLTQLNSERAAIGAMLTKRRTLLASIKTQIVQIQAREAAQQARAAATARARLARQAALARQQAAERAKAAAEAKTLSRATTTDPTTTAPAAAPDTPTTTDPTAPGTTTTANATTPTTTSTDATVPGGRPEAASIALQYLGVPYQWGGSSPSAGFDCSGLVMYVYAQLGVQLPHFAAGQYGYGTAVPRDQLQPGDLVFFDGLSHVGIYLGNGQLVHAPHTGDVVRIASLSEFAGRYVGARRL
jgi:cell wall-associated NlpC family hydrolase